VEQGEKDEKVRLAFEDMLFLIGENDVEGATLAFEEAAAEGAAPEDLAEAETALADLRLQLDPEGEARRRRMEARQTKKDNMKQLGIVGHD